MPELGRWISRDPIKEEGGINLYQFVFNSSTNHYDLLGQRITPSSIEKLQEALSKDKKVTRSLFKKAYRALGAYIFAIIYGSDKVADLTSAEQCLKIIVDDFKKTYSLSEEEVQALSAVILSGMAGKQEIIDQFKSNRKIPIYWVKEVEWPRIYLHTKGYISRKAGPSLIYILNYNGPNSPITDNNRRKIGKLKPITPGRTAENDTFDEYPLASTIQGGNTNDISVMWVPGRHNFQAGGRVGRMYSIHNMKKLDPFLTIVVPSGGIKELVK